MTAMTQARQPVEMEGRSSIAPVKGATTIHQGALVVTENSLAIPAKTGVGLTVLGVCELTVRNTGGDGAMPVKTRRGTYKFFNLPADAIVAGDAGKPAYIVDDQTVARTNGSGTRSAAGTIIHVEADGVFVRVGY